MTRQRRMRLHPAKRSRLLRHDRTRRKLVENKLRKEQFFTYSLHTIMQTVPMSRWRTAQELYPTYNVALVKFAEDKEYNTVCFRALR